MHVSVSYQPRSSVGTPLSGGAEFSSRGTVEQLRLGTFCGRDEICTVKQYSSVLYTNVMSVFMGDNILLKGGRLTSEILQYLRRFNYRSSQYEHQNNSS